MDVRPHDYLQVQHPDGTVTTTFLPFGTIHHHSSPLEGER